MAKRSEFISFAIGDERYGVDIMAVREIKGWSSVTQLPNQSDYMRGVLNLRGVMVPIVDSAAVRPRQDRHHAVSCRHHRSDRASSPSVCWPTGCLRSSRSMRRRYSRCRVSPRHARQFLCRAGDDRHRHVAVIDLPNLLSVRIDDAAPCRD